ncbi:hypothetical protein V0288_22440 [Pannus brasiliensis CCIBt3594]|uniref:Uncharacterized protein n=1 Tax=Pannus brasiliensis CCIBt3594 TaxID=1427578 RepID=A0AAW9QS64_9CHRO
MIHLLAFVPDPPPPTDAELWIDATIQLLAISRSVGVRVYPILAGIGLVKVLIKYV